MVAGDSHHKKSGDADQDEAPSTIVNKAISNAFNIKESIQSY
jgi:hypothetical protein